MTDTTHSHTALSRPFGEDAIGHDPTTGTYHARFDVDSTTTVVTIVETVATATDQNPTSLSPLFETLDPEALASLVTSARSTSIDVSFTYEGCQVTVSSHGTVVVEPLKD